MVLGITTYIRWGVGDVICSGEGVASGPVSVVKTISGESFKLTHAGGVDWVTRSAEGSSTCPGGSPRER